MEAVFWISVAFVVYTYAVYPSVIVLLAVIAGRRVEKRYRQVPVSVVLAVRDEELNIKARIENLHSQDYPLEMVEIIVVSDGSTDQTVKLARECNPPVKVIESQPVGKSGALNLGVAAASHDVIVFVDARQRFSANVIAELVSFLYDETVGAASGELIIEAGIGSDIEEGVGLYWEYEKLIRRMESAVASVVGATGSIYAIRKSLFVPLAPNTLLDDFLVPMRIVLQGYRVVFARGARAYDISSSTAGREFARKVRTLAGNFQAVAMEKRLINPLRNPIFFQFMSHKIARLFVPYFCMAALVSSSLLTGPFFRLAFAAQLIFYAVGALNPLGINKGRGGRVVRLAWTFIVLNAAAVAGLWVWATGRDENVWKKP